MTRRYYSSVATPTTMTALLAGGATEMYVVATTGFPGPVPYTLILEQNTANEEVVDVTVQSGLHLTVTRGVDGTSGTISHAIGATVQHGISGRDFDEANSHVNASTAVHGLAGAVVGTTDVQTLTNKTIPEIVALQGGARGRKNALINAVGFPINQRGAVTYPSTGYTADRWSFVLGSGATGSLQVAVSNLGALPGYSPNQLVFNRSVVGTGVSYLQQPIEHVSSLAGQTVTATILVNTGGGSVDFSLQLQQYFGSGGAPSASATTAGGGLTATGANQTFSVTFNVPSIAGKTLGANADSSLIFQIVRPVTGNGPLVAMGILAVQVELGTVFTGWEVPPVAETLAACQRYFVNRGGGTTNTYFATGCATSTGAARVAIRCPVPLRTAPTAIATSAAWNTRNAVIWDGTAGDYGLNNGPATVAMNAAPTLSTAITSTMEVGLSVPVASGLTAGAYYDFFANGVTAAILAIDAEL